MHAARHYLLFAEGSVSGFSLHSSGVLVIRFEEERLAMPAIPPLDATSTSPAAPQQIGHYQILAKIGEGGMGECIVLAMRGSTATWRSRCCRVPLLEDPYRMARFHARSAVARLLNHPRIAAIYGLEESGSMRALVMELVEGPTLAERIGRTSASARPKAGSAFAGASIGWSGKWSEGRWRGAGLRVGRGERRFRLTRLCQLRSRWQRRWSMRTSKEWSHRDLKPANIKVTLEGDGEGAGLWAGQGDGTRKKVPETFPIRPP